MDLEIGTNLNKRNQRSSAGLYACGIVRWSAGLRPGSNTVNLPTKMLKYWSKVGFGLTEPREWGIFEIKKIAFLDRAGPEAGAPISIVPALCAMRSLYPEASYDSTNSISLGKAGALCHRSPTVKPRPDAQKLGPMFTCLSSASFLKRNTGKPNAP